MVYVWAIGDGRMGEWRQIQSGWWVEDGAWVRRRVIGNLTHRPIGRNHDRLGLTRECCLHVNPITHSLVATRGMGCQSSLFLWITSTTLSLTQAKPLLSFFNLTLDMTEQTKLKQYIFPLFLYFQILSFFELDFFINYNQHIKVSWALGTGTNQNSSLCYL